MQKFNFSYDESIDDLFLFSPKAKSKGSIEIGDLILDFDSKKELVGIQIMNASKFFKELTNASNLLNLLRNLKKCNIDVKKANNMLILKIILSSENRTQEICLPVPNIMESSPALATV